MSYLYISLEPNVQPPPPPPRPLPPGKSVTSEKFAYFPTHSFWLKFTRYDMLPFPLIFFPSETLTIISVIK